MKDFRFASAVCVAAALVSAVPFASNAQPASKPGEMSMGKSGEVEATPSTRAFMAGSEAMMKGMGAPYSGDPDHDFVSHMIPHHQGAVAMAEVELKYGKDPAMRKLAKEIVQAQKKEIARMKQWQARHPMK